MMSMTISPRSEVPVYLQLAKLLRDQIRSGEFTPGALIPGEQRLAQEHGMNRETVRKALALLRGEGLIVSRKGEGTFVREQRDRRLVTIDSGTVLIVRMPSPEERVELDMDAGIPVVVLEREGQEPELLPADEVQITGR